MRASRTAVLVVRFLGPAPEGPAVVGGWLGSLGLKGDG